MMDMKRRKTKDFAVEGGSDSHPMEVSMKSPSINPIAIIMEEAKALGRKKDMVCLILSYHLVDSFNEERHKSWILDVLEINHKVREFGESKEIEMNVLEALSSKITTLQGHSIHDIEAYVPPLIINKMLEKNTVGNRGRRKQVLDFAIRQILQDAGIPELRRVGILGRNCTHKLTSRLMNLPQVREIFDVVIQVNVSSHLAIKSIEDSVRRELGLSTSSRQEVDEFLRSKNFLILLHGYGPWINLYDVGTNWWKANKVQKIVSVYGCQRFGSIGVDLEIWLEDHMLPWELFCWHVGEVACSSSIQRLAENVFKHCRDHLLATVLMARALKQVDDVHVWGYACQALGLLPTLQMGDRILFNALAFIRGRLGSVDNFVKYCASYLEREGIGKVDLIGRWMKGSLIGTLEEGEEIVQDLVNAFLLESFQNRDSVRMQDEIRNELVNLYKMEMNPILLELDGRAPKSEAWHKLSKLFENPNSLELNVLFLQVNPHLRVIPPQFFECMFVLQILDLSRTRIRSLPQSLFNLIQLRKLFLRDCPLFMELPPKVGELHQLEVLDLEGTEIINLPITIGKLTNLRCLKVSFYGYNTYNRKNNQSNRIIPQNVISNLLQLEELSIDVNPDDERWNLIVKNIVKETCSLNRLETLKLYLTEVLLLNDLINGSSSIDLSIMKFRVIVGSHLKRIISRLPLEVVLKFEEEERCLKYVNGEGVPIEIKEVLQNATALFLDRHLTLTSLSKFGNENMKNLKSCILVECNEIQTLADAGADKNDVLGSLEYLNLHYMKNLRSIWRGPLGWGSLSHLKSLALYSCPQLTTIFTLNMLRNLYNLEELVVEDCPEINNLVTHEVPAEDLSKWIRYLPKLKKISLHYMPKLVSISGLIAPSLEWLSFYDCPNLKTLSLDEVDSYNLKVIIGEADWWSTLRWEKPEQFQTSNMDTSFQLIASILWRAKSEWFQPSKLDSIFVPIERDKDFTTQLAEINHQLQARMQETESSQRPGSGISSKQKQVV